MPDQGYYLQEHTFFPFGKGTLTSNGIQYSTEATCASATVRVLAESVTCHTGHTGTIEELSFSLTAALKSDASTKDTVIQWDAKQTDSTTWVSLVSAAIVTPADASVYHDDTRSGTKDTETNLLRCPINVRCRFHGEDATCDANCKVKNSSWVKLKWRPSVQG